MLRRLALLVAVVPLVAAKPAPASRPAPLPAAAPPPAAASAPGSPVAVGKPSAAEVARTVAESLTFDQKTKVLDAGAEPRAVLRYRPEPGATATFEIVSRSAIDMSMTLPDGSTLAVPMGNAMPAIVMTTRNTVGQPAANGFVPVRIEQLGSRIDGPAAPEVADAIRQSLGATNGLVLEMLLNAEGRPVQLDVVSGGDPAMTDLVQQIADQTIDRITAFPSEPIGRGARWTNDLGLSISGLDLIVTQTVTARAITADGVDLDVVMQLALGSGGLVIPGLPPGTPPPQITSFTGTGNGGVHVDLGTLVSTGTVTMDVDTALQMTTPGVGVMGMVMKVHQVSETRPAK